MGCYSSFDGVRCDGFGEIEEERADGIFLPD